MSLRFLSADTSAGWPKRQLERDLPFLVAAITNSLRGHQVSFWALTTAEFIKLGLGFHSCPHG